jgi:hypothetical protein
LVSTIPPMGSSSIFSMALGPRHDLMMSATVFAAVMLESWALRPNCRSPPGVCVSVVVLVGWSSRTRGKRTHNYHGRLHLEDSSKQTLLGRTRGLFGVTGRGVSFAVPGSSTMHATFSRPRSLAPERPPLSRSLQRRCSGVLSHVLSVLSFFQR